MNDTLGAIGSVFDFFSSTTVAGMSLTTWIVISLVLSAIALFIRGNK